MTDRKRAVREAFEAIAEEFAATRREPWEPVERFVEDLDGPDDHDGAVAVDAGCGNGRHLPVLARRFDRVVGVDAARDLLALADAHHGRVVGDLNALPLRDGAADAALCVAAIHHLGARERRVGALDELARVLRPGGRCLVAVWALAHPRFDGSRDEIRAQGGDVTVPWETEDGSVDRFYHLYEHDEFRRDVKASAFDVEDVWTEDGNHYAAVGVWE